MFDSADARCVEIVWFACEYLEIKVFGVRISVCVEDVVEVIIVIGEEGCMCICGSVICVGMGGSYVEDGVEIIIVVGGEVCICICVVVVCLSMGSS